MPELSRFGGMIIYMFFKDMGSIISLMFMFTMENTKPLLQSTVKCWQVLFLENN